MNIGIDLGTFNSAAAVGVGRGQIVMVESKKGPGLYGKSFPSFVRFDHNGRKDTVGKLAKEDLADNPKLVIWGVKRLVGLSYEKARERGELKRFQYDVEEGSGGSILIKVGEERFSPSDILAYILREIKEDAENSRINPMLAGTIEKTVVSVPAYFDGTRVGPIKEAARNAGLGEIETIAEPTAAALTYGYTSKQMLTAENKILTFDMGAGTLDVTIMLLLYEGGKFIAGERCTSGEEALGGIDMDDELTSYLIKKHKLSGIENEPRSLAMLKDEAEKSKIALSTRPIVEFPLPHREPVILTRKELEDVLKKPVLEKCRGPIQVALQQSHLEAGKLDHVLFVGGPTYMPCVRATVADELKKLGARKELLQELENWEREKLPVNPMQCVAMGAALKAAGIVKPGTKTDPNGYGTIVDTNCYYSVIPPNSNYPITSKPMRIVHLNPEARRVPIPLVAKRAYSEAGKIIYKYYHLGDYDCFIRSTGENPEIDITMALNEDKELITTFTHWQTHESVRFEGLDKLKGNESPLQEWSEETSSRRKGGDGGGGGKPGGDTPPRRRDWTQKELDKATHVARMLVNDYAERSTHSKVTRKKQDLLDLLGTPLDARRDTQKVFRGIQELLDALRNARVINENEFLNASEELRGIESSS